jgi:predicted MPP superfamily phosphohydrolase
MNKKIVLIAVIGILVAGNIMLGVGYYFSQEQIKIEQQSFKAKEYNAKVLQFTNLFVEKVLQAETEVSFDDRLKLENTVRDLNDPQILAQWQKFTASQTEQEAQQEVKNLLELLVKKIPQ